MLDDVYLEKNIKSQYYLLQFHKKASHYDKNCNIMFCHYNALFVIMWSLFMKLQNMILRFDTLFCNLVSWITLLSLNLFSAKKKEIKAHTSCNALFFDVFTHKSLLKLISFERDLWVNSYFIAITSTGSRIFIHFTINHVTICHEKLALKNNSPQQNWH